MSIPLATASNAFVKEKMCVPTPRFGDQGMGTLFVESLKKLESDIIADTRNPFSLLQLSMRYLSLTVTTENYDKFLCKCALCDFRIVIRQRLPQADLPRTLAEKLKNEVNEL